MRLPIFFPRSHLAQAISNQKQTGVLPGKDPCGRRHYAINYFVNFICSPSVAQRPLVSQHISVGRYFERPSFFSRVCEPASSDAMIEARFKPKPCACGALRQRACLGPADLILPSSLPSFALSGEDSSRARFVSSPAAQLGGFAEHI
jgi:hypothetical protein